jgi:hypothetical protein
VNAARLAVVSRQWLAAKLLPQYADRQTTELVGANGRDLIPAEPLDPSKLALALLNVLHAGPGGKNRLDALEASPAAVPAATTLLSAPDPIPAHQPEPAPTPAMVREHVRYLNVIHGRDREY